MKSEVERRERDLQATREEVEQETAKAQALHTLVLQYRKTPAANDALPLPTSRTASIINSRKSHQSRK